MTTTMSNKKIPAGPVLDAQPPANPRSRRTRSVPQKSDKNLHQRKPPTSGSPTPSLFQPSIPRQQNKSDMDITRQIQVVTNQHSSGTSDTSTPSFAQNDLQNVADDAAIQSRTVHPPQSLHSLGKPNSYAPRDRKDTLHSRDNPDDDSAQSVEINPGHPRPPRPVLSMSIKPTSASRDKPLMPGHNTNRSSLGSPKQPPALVGPRPLTWIVRAQTLNFGLERVIADRREREIEMDLDQLGSHLENADGASLRASPRRSDKQHQHRGSRLYGRCRSGQKSFPLIIRTHRSQPEHEAVLFARSSSFDKKNP